MMSNSFTDLNNAEKQAVVAGAVAILNNQAHVFEPNDELCLKIWRGKVNYEAYSEKAGGVTFDGKPLPTFEELGENRQACWIAAADVIYNL